MLISYLNLNAESNPATETKPNAITLMKTNKRLVDEMKTDTLQQALKMNDTNGRRQFKSMI